MKFTFTFFLLCMFVINFAKVPSFEAGEITQDDELIAQFHRTIVSDIHSFNTDSPNLAKFLSHVEIHA